jgi:hypothetical protein
MNERQQATQDADAGFSAAHEALDVLSEIVTPS